MKKISIGCIQKPLANYRIHNENYSKKKLNLYINELKDWINENSENLSKNNLSVFHQKIYLFKLILKKYLIFFKACSSVVERYVDIVEVISSILITPTKILLFAINSLFTYRYKNTIKPCLVIIAKGLHPIPSRTRKLSPSAPMVLCLKIWESRTLPGYKIL